MRLARTHFQSRRLDQIGLPHQLQLVESIEAAIPPIAALEKLGEICLSDLPSELFRRVKGLDS